MPTFTQIGTYSHWSSGYKFFITAKAICPDDSKAPFGSRKDRHEWIAEGNLGPEPFRRVMRDQRFQGIIKILETPKGDDPEKNDRRMLRRLRAYQRNSKSGKKG